MKKILKFVAKWALFLTLGFLGMAVGFLWGYIRTGYGVGVEAFYDWERD